MLIIDDLLLAPFKGLLWVFEKVRQAAVDELEGQGDRLRGELSDLYMQLETGRISEEEFDAKEKELLERLDEIKKTQARTREQEPARRQGSERQ